MTAAAMGILIPANANRSELSGFENCMPWPHTDILNTRTWKIKNSPGDHEERMFLLDVYVGKSM